MNYCTNCGEVDEKECFVDINGLRHKCSEDKTSSVYESEEDYNKILDINHKAMNNRIVTKNVSILFEAINKCKGIESINKKVFETQYTLEQRINVIKKEVEYLLGDNITT